MWLGGIPFVSFLVPLLFGPFVEDLIEAVMVEAHRNSETDKKRHVRDRKII